MLARTKIQPKIPFFISTTFFGLMCIIITWTGEAGGANFLFIYLLPSLVIIELGMRIGIIMSSVFIIIIFLQMVVQGFSRFEYQFDFSIRMLASYLLVFSVMVALEVSRRTKDRLIGVQHKRLHEHNEELNFRIKEFDYQPVELPQEKPVKENGLQVKTKGTLQFIPFDEISHIEVINHNVYVKKQDKSAVKIYTSFGKIEDQLSHDSRFVKCHRSYIININEVASLSKQTLTMKNGTILSISRNYSYIEEKFTPKNTNFTP